MTATCGPNTREAITLRPSQRTLLGLDALNFLLADVQAGVGPFLAIYLAGYNWNEERVGLALTVGGIAGILAQTPAGALVDSLRAKRALVAAAVVALAAGALLIAFAPSFWPVMAAQTLIGGTSSVFGPAICAISLGIVGPARSMRARAAIRLLIPPETWRLPCPWACSPTSSPTAAFSSSSSLWQFPQFSPYS